MGGVGYEQEIQGVWYMYLFPAYATQPESGITKWGVVGWGVWYTLDKIRYTL